MTLLLEIECDGPRPVACLTHFLVIARVLREQGGLREGNAWDVVRPVPRHPDWGTECRIVLAQEGRLIPGKTPPEVVRTLEDGYRVLMPEYRVKLLPVFDPNLVFPPSATPPPRGTQLPPGALHMLLNPQGS